MRKVAVFIILVFMFELFACIPVKAIHEGENNEIIGQEVITENSLTEQDSIEKNEEVADASEKIEKQDDNNEESTNNDSTDSFNKKQEKEVSTNEELTQARNVTENEKKQETNTTDSKEVGQDESTQEIVSEEPGVQYNVRVENSGWQETMENGEFAGTEGKGLKLEAIKISLINMGDVSVKYQAHVQDVGWQSWKSDGQRAGMADGQSKRIEAIKIQLEQSEDYSIMYRVHIQNIGWQSWKSDGEIAGTEGQSLRIEAIEIKVVDKIKKAKINIDSPVSDGTIFNQESFTIKGWKVSNVSNTKLKIFLDDVLIDESKYEFSTKDSIFDEVLGYGTKFENPTPAFSCNVSTNNLSSGIHNIKVVAYTPEEEVINEDIVKCTIFCDFHVSYCSHVQNVGWQDYVKEKSTSGTEGRSLRLEAMRIKLNNAPKGVKIKYKAHVQNIGWQGWCTDNQLAGTEGQFLRMEAVQIQLENLEDYTVEYQVHVQDLGWSQWCIDGEIAGTVGQAKRIEAIRIRIVPKYKRRYTGIDVSVFNGKIDWNTVKNSGIDFAMIRVGFRGYGSAGNIVDDSRFKENIENAKNAGVKVGVYFVTQAVNESEALEEANWVLDRIKAYKIDYPVAMDVEFSAESNHNGRADRIDKATRTAVVKKFCQRIQSAGYTPMIYLNVDWAKNYVNMSQLTNYDTWIAHYRNNPNLSPNYNGSYTIWQYTSTGRVNGVGGNVDCNIGYKKY